MPHATEFTVVSQYGTTCSKEYNLRGRQSLNYVGPANLSNLSDMMPCEGGQTRVGTCHTTPFM